MNVQTSYVTIDDKWLSRQTLDKKYREQLLISGQSVIISDERYHRNIILSLIIESKDCGQCVVYYKQKVINSFSINKGIHEYPFLMPLLPKSLRYEEIVFNFDKVNMITRVWADFFCDPFYHDWYYVLDDPFWTNEFVATPNNFSTVICNDEYRIVENGICV